VVHKRRWIYGAPDDFATHKVKKPLELISLMDASALLSATPEERQGISQEAASFRLGISDGDFRASGERVGEIFSSFDFIAPTIFNITRSRRLTERLYQPNCLSVSGWWGGSMDGVREILENCPTLVKSFGPPYRMEDEDHFQIWWDFVVFDGYLWHSFRLKEDFSVQMEINLSRQHQTGVPDLAKVIVDEFRKASDGIKRGDHGG
jgi:hypothetical protein